MKITNNRFIALFALLVTGWVLVYQQALLGMEDIWSRSDTFAHGYFILPISLWLIWRDKAHLLASTTQTTWLPLPILLGSLFVWLFAFAADINVLGQLSAVVSLISIIWMLIGNQLAWRYKFPLVYLLFAVPMGENLIPMLQDITAWFTVNLLKLNGIPVFIDGLYIQTPTGLFEVAVACSGIRYLIASVAVGALYAYLTYNSTKKQIIFILISILMPIVANGVRAYGIVAIAHYSDMKYATGADHLVYGWLFFGVVIMLMFWIGGFFADKDVVENTNNSGKASEQKDQNKNKLTWGVPATTFIFLALTLVLLKQIPTTALTQNRVEVKNQATHASWGITFIDAFSKNVGTSETGIETFQAVYGNKQSQGELVSWQNVTHDHDHWTIVESKELIVNNQPAKLVHLRNIKGENRSYLYQYKVGSFYSVSASKVKLMQAWNSLSRQSDFSEINAVSIANIDDQATAEQLLKQSLTAFIAAKDA